MTNHVASGFVKAASFTKLKNIAGRTLQGGARAKAFDAAKGARKARQAAVAAEGAMTTQVGRLVKTQRSVGIPEGMARRGAIAASSKKIQASTAAGGRARQAEGAHQVASRKAKDVGRSRAMTLAGAAGGVGAAAGLHAYRRKRD